MAMATHLAVVAAALLVVAAALCAGASVAQAAAAAGGAAARVPLPLGVRVQCTGLHAVRPGETCASVARAAGLTVGQFALLNPNVTCAAILPHGRRVCVRGSAIG